MAKSIWPKASSVRVARALKGHGAVGLAVGALIYILSITGVLSVFNHELQRWEQPGAPELAAIAPEAAARAVAAVLADEPSPTSHLFVHLPTPDLPRVIVSTDTRAVFVDGDGALAGPEAHPWTQFVLDLHYYLTLPSTAGLIVVGALGVMLLALALSGFMAHPRIFRDAFTFRKGAGRLTTADLHNRLAVWTAPFHVSSALTGAMLGLATILGFAIAAQHYDGDVEAVFEPIFGAEPAADDRPAPLAEIATPLRAMAADHAGVIPNYLIVHEPGTAGQHVTVLALHGRRLIFGEYYNFDAAGRFTGTTGLADGTIGQQIAASTYQVHFGSYGGLPVKLAYLVFGVALSVIVASGVSLYLTRRRAQGHAAPRLEGAWAGVVWGAPAALALALLASVVGGLEGGGLVALFWTALAMAVAAGLTVGDRAAVARALREGGGCVLAAAVVAHAAVWWTAFDSPVAPVLSGALAIVAALALWRPIGWCAAGAARAVRAVAAVRPGRDDKAVGVLTPPGNRQRP